MNILSHATLSDRYHVTVIKQTMSERGHEVVNPLVSLSLSGSSSHSGNAARNHKQAILFARNTFHFALSYYGSINKCNNKSHLHNGLCAGFCADVVNRYEINYKCLFKTDTLVCACDKSLFVPINTGIATRPVVHRSALTIGSFYFCDTLSFYIIHGYGDNVSLCSINVSIVNVKRVSLVVARFLLVFVEQNNFISHFIHNYKVCNEMWQCM